VGVEVSNAEHEEGKVEREEEHEKCHGGLQSADEEDCGEDEPSLHTQMLVSSRTCLPHH
jgi:hypothetical protein